MLIKSEPCSFLENSQSCSQILEDGLDLGDVSVQLFPADERLRNVYIRDLPVEIDDVVVSSFLADFGEVLSVDYCFFDHYPTVRNGNRVAKVLLDRDIPQHVEVEGCSCRVWYPRQPAQCSVCKEFGHRAPACPLSGRCRRCHQPGHMARECTQAWGPLFSTPRSVLPDHSMEIEDEVPVPVTTNTNTSSSVPVPVTTNSVITAPSSVPASCPSVTATTATATISPVSVTASKSCSSVTASTATVTATSTSTVAATIPPVTASAPCSSVTATTTTVSMSSTSTAATIPSGSTSASASKVKIRHTVKTLRLELAKKYPCTELPDLDNVTGKEWDSRAKVYIRQRVKIMVEDRELGLTARDYATWTIDDIRELTDAFCGILCIRNYLVHFIFGILESYWKNCKAYST